MEQGRAEHDACGEAQVDLHADVSDDPDQWDHPTAQAGDHNQKAVS